MKHCSIWSAASFKDWKRLSSLWLQRFVDGCRNLCSSILSLLCCWLWVFPKLATGVLTAEHLQRLRRLIVDWSWPSSSETLQATVLLVPLKFSILLFLFHRDRSLSENTYVRSIHQLGVICLGRDFPNWTPDSYSSHALSFDLPFLIC